MALFGELPLLRKERGKEILKEGLTPLLNTLEMGYNVSGDAKEVHKCLTYI